MGDIVVGPHRYVDKLAGDIDLEAVAALERVGEAPELLDEFGQLDSGTKNLPEPVESAAARSLRQ